MDWQLVEMRGLKPPIVPHVQHPGDTRNFDKYPDPEPLGPAPSDYCEFFVDF